VLTLVILLFLFEPALLVLEELVKLANKLKESSVVSLFLDQCAQAMHAFSFVWFHQRLRWSTIERGFYDEGVFLCGDCGRRRRIES
jgi:hypothetical protein